MVLSALAWQLSWLLEKRAYKLQYSAEIKRYSREFDIDPDLVAAIIHCESSNRHTVVSRAGAKGLMQIMPDTGFWIAEKLGEEDYRKTCKEHALPENFEHMEYADFLSQRRLLMAQIIRKAYEQLCE